MSTAETPMTVAEQVVIRLAGDSGDGMQVTGDQFTRTSALAGNDIATLPDFPAEIRAPAGTREGVSAFQIHFSSHDIFTPGDESDVLVAMNAAALVTNLRALRKGGLVVANSDKFGKADLEKARLTANPLEDGTLEGYQLFQAPISTLTKKAIEGSGLNPKESDRCKNFFALGMMYWLYSRDMNPTERWVEEKFKSPYKEANLAALRAGWSYADTVEFFRATAPRDSASHKVSVSPATDLQPGTYRQISGNVAAAIGLVAAAQQTGRPLFYGSYPITPASDILHSLAPFKNYGVVTFQAEDEIAAVCSAIGAAYGGAIGVTGTSGPGMALKAEAIGLAVMTELPLVIVNVQRAGPSTGMPTKTEQADLFQALYGRNGESPVVILAPQTPADCFDIAVEAVKIATTSMIPVVILSDGYIANGAEPWRLPDLDNLPDLTPKFATNPEGFQPYARDPETLGRPWALPGTPGLEHRIGGIEKQDGTGHISYDPANHHHMCELRAEKVKRVANRLPPTSIYGFDPTKSQKNGTSVLVVGWGSTYGAIRTAVQRANTAGQSVGHVHLRHLNPLPNDLPDILRRYDRVLVPELNLGQLVRILRAEYLVDAVSYPKVHGQPFTTREISARIDALIGGAR
jgi:2-oxoglutarate ferredoxin oxidoreductase subunit alpha